MRRFAALFTEIDATTRTSVKEAALQRYFTEAPPRDAAWALYVLTGNRLKRVITRRQLMATAAQHAELPDWLMDTCAGVVGDTAETISLVLPPNGEDVADEPLHRVIEERLLPMREAGEADKPKLLRDAWATMSPTQRFVFHKLCSGTFRFGAAKRLVTRGFAAAFDIDPAIMEHRLLSRWQPTPEDYARLTADDDSDDAARPYPFYLASPVNEASAADAAHIADLCGPISDWQIEPKYDGIRAQLIARPDAHLAWSRGMELLNDAFPELTAAAHALPEGTVLDGELLAWERERPLPFGALQKRLNRKGVQPMLFTDVPIAFVAYDLLESDDRDRRTDPIDERRRDLETIVAIAQSTGDPTLRLSTEHRPADWSAAEVLVHASRDLGVEGLMLKRRGSPYGVGRTRGDWWKWKVDPYTVDCVMLYAQRGHGRRAARFTDYTFGVWTDATPNENESPTRAHEQTATPIRQLITVTKAYSGLTDDEIDEVDAWIRNHTIGRRGGFRQVEPELVFEIAFEGINASNRHQSGVALRFPRMHRWRKDKTADQADTLSSLRALLPKDSP